MRTLAVLLLFASVAAPCEAYAQDADGCDNKFDEVRRLIDGHTTQWTRSFQGAGFPQAVLNSYLMIVNYSREAAINGAEIKKTECNAKYSDPVDITSTAVSLFSRGLSSIAADEKVYVSVSEIMSGYPLGGSNALIMKLKKQVEQGDKASVIRDPWKCLSFERKC
jgi:hypothetical protein